jgi:hypothetical protein
VPKLKAPKIEKVEGSVRRIISLPPGR